MQTILDHFVNGYNKWMVSRYCVLLGGDCFIRVHWLFCYNCTTIVSILCTLCFQLAVHASIALVGRCLELNMNITKELLGFFIDTSHYSTSIPCYTASQCMLSALLYSAAGFECFAIYGYVVIMKFSSSAT